MSSPGLHPPDRPAAPGPPPGPPDPPDQGFGPTPDPTRSGALWVGGAGVALLLAAAAVLTAVRWDDIGQSAKLGGLVAITLGLLAAGQRFKSTIPITAHAILHLGALLIPFDMAAIATLAGRSWQETLLLTSVTGVVAWHPMERAIGSAVLQWCARGSVVLAAAGIAAVSSLAMAPVLAAFAVVALALRKPIEAGTWAAIAALLPLASFVVWPTRIAGAMSDLGFDATDHLQPLIAGVLASITLIGVTRLVPRIEIAWSSVITAGLTATVALDGFGSAQANLVMFGAAFIGVELLAMAANEDQLWKSVTAGVAIVVEYLAVAATTCVGLIALVLGGWMSVGFEARAVAASAILLALGWLTADLRRLDAREDWLVGMLVGSNWAPTTIMFPAAVLGATWAFAPTGLAIASVAILLAVWMVATWRTGAVIAASSLIAIAVIAGSGTVSHWAELALGGGALAVMSLAAQIQLRKKDAAGSLLAAVVGSLALLVMSQDLVWATNGRAHLGVIALAWTSSWLVEYQTNGIGTQIAGWVGRGVALVTVFNFMTHSPPVGIALCAAVAVLAAVDYRRAHHALPTARAQLTTFAAIAGGAAGFAAAPVAGLAGLDGSLAGAALAVAGFVITGLCLVSPRQFEIPLATAAGVMTLLGLGLTAAQPAMFAFALIVAGCSVMFVAAALRDLLIGSIGYGVAALGLALELAALDVTWLEPYLVMPAIAALVIGRHFHRAGISSWITYSPTIVLFSYVAMADRFVGGSAWHAVIAGAVGVLAIITGGYRRLVGPLMTGSAILAIVVGYESLGPAALVPTWAWLALGGSVLLAAGVAMERSDTTPLERGQQLRQVVAAEFS